MTVPLKYINVYVPVKHFLTSYRALSDAKMGIKHLEEYLQSETFLLSDWKVIWIGTCALLRTSVNVFEIDKKSCINPTIRKEICREWNIITKNKDEHKIFWKFLREERGNVLHQYKWAAYEAWMQQDGTIRPARLSLLDVRPQDVRSVLIMRGGYYKDRDSLDLLKESAAWVEERIFAAIHRAGFDPDEERNVVSFQQRPLRAEKGLLDM